ncbi:MAG: histidinol-phosphate transaminase [Gallionellales bacterium 35-53-114]|jgi:histidinol-phosphate aminotransferase|nr:MAG: histidinol-phosphate transaminase [Gallionellales bacterium 35-53-114]OYZ65338.1 MAG: histidinol-phosphate transaminase [Gallionellales bacterium 24-53-125]OZB08245.1 MAG: histidinol-phosphate transaminase [Gallionellales bacterium 39-52-133]HQS58175.1 histidinol-phosphate transaminase [Gallionellaceae bacterium]HQS73730.1 histidinol-phosphate transaminase [Gallionellaceae bacterium]
MNYTELAPAYIRAIAPYQPGKPIAELERELGISGIVKLASNENPLGASPKAVAAMHEAIKTIALYPDGNGFELKDALTKRYAVAHANLVLGNGSNDLLELASRAFLAPGDVAVYAAHAFAVYALATQAVGAKGITVPAKEFGHDLEAMLKAAVQHKAKMVFIANPNNPTGTYLDADALQSFMQALPANILVVLDEAYNEYLPPAQHYDSVSWLAKYPNLIISRTFSKAYGLAGLRVGYAIAHEQITDMMNRVRQPFNVNSIAQAAAVAALHDMDFVQQTYELNQRGMLQITDGLNKLGLSYIPSFGNFISFRIGGATAMYRRLLELGVIVRPVANYDMPDYLRVSIGLETENEKFLTALAQAIKEKK